MAKTSKERPRLGRGLNSLISMPHLETENTEAGGNGPTVPQPQPSSPPPPLGVPTRGREWMEIPVEMIHPNPHQPRRHFAEQPLYELAASLKATGMVQPVVVRRLTDGFELIAGERRWRAAKLAEIAAIPAIIRSADSITQAQMALVENIHREDLNPIERGEAYRALINQLGLTQSELAGRLGEDRTTINHYLRLLDLSPAAKEGVLTGRISMGHAKLLAGVPDIAEQDRLAQLILSQDLTVRNLERLLSLPPAATTAKLAEARTPHVQQLEKNLTGQLGMRVQLRTAAKKGRGRLIIHYTSLDQFDDLLARMGVKAGE